MSGGSMSLPEVLLSTHTLEIKRSKRLKGQAPLPGDARQGFQALLLSALAEGQTRIENLPDTPWFREALQAFVRLGYAQQALDGHWLIHGGSKPVEGDEPLRLRHEADLLALAGFLSGQGVRRVLEVDLDGVSGDVLDLLGKLIRLETPGDFSARPDAPAQGGPAAGESREAAPAPALAESDEAPVPDSAAGPDDPEAAEGEGPRPGDMDGDGGDGFEGNEADEAYEEFDLAPVEEAGATSASFDALRAISPEEKPRRARKTATAASADAEGPSPGELESGESPDEEGRFLRIIPGPLQKKAADLAAGTLKGRIGAGPARLVDLGWDEPLSKIVLLAWHIGAGKALDLSLLKGGPELLETVAAQFDIPLKVDRKAEDEGDELARRIARQMRAAGKQDPASRVRLSAPFKARAQSYTVPADIGATAALALAATLIKGSDITLEGVVLNPTRAGFLAALRRMGADIEVVSRRERQGETLGVLRVRSADLLGKRFGAEHLAHMRDEVFLLMVAASFAEGETVLRDIAHLRRHRRDLLKSFAAALKSAGVEIGEIEDGLVIRGRSDYDGTAYDALNHSPLALACLVMALKSHGSSTLAGAGCLGGTYPGLLDLVAALAAPDRPAEKSAERGPGKSGEKSGEKSSEGEPAAEAAEDGEGRP